MLICKSFLRDDGQIDLSQFRKFHSQSAGKEFGKILWIQNFTGFGCILWQCPQVISPTGKEVSTHLRLFGIHKYLQYESVSQLLAEKINLDPPLVKFDVWVHKTQSGIYLASDVKIMNPGYAVYCSGTTDFTGADKGSATVPPNLYGSNLIPFTPEIILKSHVKKA